MYREKNIVSLERDSIVSGGHTTVVTDLSAIADKHNGQIKGQILGEGLTYRALGENRELRDAVLKDINNGEVVEIQHNRDPVVIVGGVANYGHFMFEFLPKIVEALSLFGTRYSFVVSERLARWLNLANLISYSLTRSLPRYIVVPDSSRIKISNCILIESTRARRLQYIYSRSNLCAIRNSAGNGMLDADLPRKLYLRRSDNGWRNISNSQSVRSLCESKGYVIIEMGKLRQRDQIRLLANCEEVVVEAGADSMAPSLCREGCSIIELMPKGMVAGFGSISSQFALGHKYTRIIGNKTDINYGRLPIDSDYNISEDELMSCIGQQ